MTTPPKTKAVQRRLIVLAALRIVALSGASVLGAQTANPESPVQIEKLETTYRFECDGSGQMKVHARWQALTAAGVKMVSQFSIPYASELEEVRVAYFKTVKKNGETLEGDSKQVFESTPPTEVSAPVFSGTKLKQFVLPNVEVGDSVEYEFTKTTKPQKPNEFWAIHLPLRNVVVRSESVTLDIPADRKVILHFDSALPHTTEKSGGRDVEKWTFSNPAIAPATDGKPIFAVSTILSWDALGEWLRSLNNESAAVTPEIKSLVEKLVAGKTAEKQKVDAIYQYVSTNIRYVSISFGLGRLQPHWAGEVLKNAYGDCKDKSALFSALLQAAGIRSHAVLASPGNGIVEPEVPMPTQFTHEFTAVDGGSSTAFLDTTLEFAEPEVLMPGVRGKKALLIEQNKSQLINIPERSPVPESTVSKLTGKVSASGKFTGENHVKASGLGAVLVRRIFQEGTEEQKQSLLKQLAGQELREATISKITNSNPKDLLTPFSFGYTIEHEGFGPPEGMSKRFTLLTSNLFDPAQLAKAVKPTKPVPVPAEYGTRSIDLVIDPVFTIDNSMPVHFKTNFGSYNSEFRYDSGHLYLDRSLQINGIPVQPEDWSALLGFLTGIESDATRGFSLEHKAAENSHPTSHSLSLAQEGREALDRRDFHAAVAALAQVTKVNPGDRYAWNNLGLAYLGLHQLDKAEDVLKHSIEVNPNDQFAYNNLGRVYVARNEPDRAIPLFRKQLQTNPQDRFAHGNLANALELKGDWKEAEKEATAANKIQPGNALGWIYLGRAQAKLGKADDASKSFDRALQASDNTIMQNNVAYQLADAGIDVDKAWQLASSALTIQASEVCNPEKLVNDPGCTERLGRLSAVLDTAGWILVKQGKQSLALPYLTAAYAIAPRPANAMHLAFVDAETGKLEEAIQLYAAARLAHGFREDDARPIREELVKKAGDDSALEQKVRSVPKDESSLGLVPGASVASAGETSTSGKEISLQALVEPSGAIKDLQAESGSSAPPSLISQLKGIKLPALAWPGRELRSVRTIRVLSSGNTAHLVVAYVVAPEGENLQE